MENSFGSFLKQKRQEKNLTQKELSQKLFVSESAVSKWEKDISHPDITLLPQLAEILEVTEHELITASIDKQTRDEKKQAKKWRIISFSWSLFFYIAYATALIPCFICNLAINKGLTWFWIVLSALILSFTFTNLPKLIKKHKLIILPLSMYLSLCLLLGICAIYSKGNWFFIAILSILFGLSIIFTPIYISKYKIFEKVKKYNNFISIAVNFVLLNILLIVLNIYSHNNNWYLKIALPITIYCFIVLNILMCIRFLKLNKLLNTSIILLLISLFTYIPPLIIKVKNADVQKEINAANIFKADFSNWSQHIDSNINCIIILTLIALSIIFFVFGIIRHRKLKNK